MIPWLNTISKKQQLLYTTFGCMNFVMCTWYVPLNGFFLLYRHQYLSQRVFDLRSRSLLNRSLLIANLKLS